MNAEYWDAETIVPSQWVDIHTCQESAFKRLCLAILVDAIQCYGGRGTGCPQRERKRVELEARSWIASNGGGLFSFKTVCETLGIEPDMLRSVLRGNAPEVIRARTLVGSHHKIGGRSH